MHIPIPTMSIPISSPYNQSQSKPNRNIREASQLDSKESDKISSSDLNFSFSSQEGSLKPQSSSPPIEPIQKRQCVRSSSSHNGTSLDQVTDYLIWFLHACPGCEEPIKKALQILNQHFGQQKVIKSSNEVITIPSKSQSLTEDSSSFQQLSSASSAIQFAEPIAKTNTGGPILFKRNVSTTTSQRAKIELMTQRPTIWSEANAPVNKLDDSTDKDSKLPEKKVKTITLSKEQNNVIELARLGYNIFYTGSAGTGKSLLLKSLIKALKKQHPDGSVAVTASTGLAACNIGGMTLHSLTGIGLGKGDARTLLKRVKRQQRNRKRWKNLEVLIIDEISMIDGILFDKLDYVARHMKKRLDEPFGGIQLIVCGDFYQLPPVSKGSDPVFAFESKSWKNAIQFTIILKKVFRQQGDKDFVRMLNEVREGRVSPGTLRKFKALERPLESRNGVIPAQLYPTRNQVDYANRSMLKHIGGDEVVFEAVDGGSMSDPETRERLLGNFLTPKMVNLKRGAQVMMVKNIDETLVNGSLGKVIDFIDPSTYMFYKRMEHDENLAPEEMQMEIEKVKEKKEDESNKKNKNNPNLIKDPQRLPDVLDDNIFSFMDELDDGKHKLTKAVKESISRKKELIKQLYASSKAERMPLVRFVLSDGTTRDVLVEPETFSVEDEFERPIVSRTQIPLILAWSLSIHKAQGQTLPLVKVDLKHVFEKGQAYVALSRATSRRGLQIEHFDPTKIHAHERVIQFYNKLMGTDEAMALHKKIVANRKSTGETHMNTKGSIVEQLRNLDKTTASATDFPSSSPDTQQPPVFERESIFKKFGTPQQSSDAL